MIHDDFTTLAVIVGVAAAASMLPWSDDYPESESAAEPTRLVNPERTS